MMVLEVVMKRGHYLDCDVRDLAELCQWSLIRPELQNFDASLTSSLGDSRMSWAESLSP